MSRWILRMSYCGSNAGMETSAPLINAVVNNAVPLQLAHQSDSTSNNPHPALFSGRLAAPYFEINVLRSGLFSGQKCGSSYKSLTLLHFWTGSSEWCTECQGRHSSRKRLRPAEYIKMIMWYRSVYNQTASDAWRYNNPVYKLMADKLQLMLINVLLDYFLNIKVSQDSVATRLRCGGICNDQFITQSLLSPRVKEFWKSVNICRS